MIMIGAGTGLARFRGFLQERAAQRAGGVSVATSLPFSVAAPPRTTMLCQDDLRTFEADGIVKVEAVFARQGDPKRRYVQDSIVERADDVWNLIENQHANILVPKGASITALTIMLHRDREVWGEDAEEFNPDHLLPETRANLPANAFKPFVQVSGPASDGSSPCKKRCWCSACSCNEFIDQLNYQLKIKESFTIKPGGLLIGVRLRPGRKTGATPVATVTVPSSVSARAPAPRHPSTWTLTTQH
jgi:Cytochrome P450